jgi:hypothetical protein
MILTAGAQLAQGACHDDVSQRRGCWVDRALLQQAQEEGPPAVNQAPCGQLSIKRPAASFAKNVKRSSR